MKKVLKVLAVAATVTALVCSCSSGAKVTKIGVIQLVEHPALDASYKGFVDGLKAAGYEDGKNIKIDYVKRRESEACLLTVLYPHFNGKILLS